MTPIEFDGQTLIIAKDQPEYLPLPAHVTHDGIVTCCWRLTWRERIKVLLSGRIWHRVMTLKRPLQPQAISTVRPML